MPVLPGKTGFISVAGARLPFTSWSIKLQNEIEDVSNAVNGGTIVSLPNISSIDITAEGFWPGTLGIREGTVYTFGFGATSAGPVFAITAMVRDLTITQDVRGVAKFTITAQSTGNFIILF
jgi:hypothetical protein